MSDPQPLNSLERFRKRPERLVLEQYSHCEVPAGCGGVVLRWRTLRDGAPVDLCVYTQVRSTCFLDGGEPQTGRLELAPGPHAAAFVLPDADLSAGLIAFAAGYDPDRRASRLPVAVGVAESGFRVVSSDDGTWKFSLQEPHTPDWTRPEFDDRDWPTLAVVPAPALTPFSLAHWAYTTCTAQGAVILGISAEAAVGLGISAPEGTSWWRRVLRRPTPPRRGTIWIRKAFEVPSPQ